jgi:hypothetical protein
MIKLNSVKQMKKKIETFWSDSPLSLERILLYRLNRKFVVWRVHDRIKRKFHWGKLRWRYRMKLIRVRTKIT